jgi:hypothetical protein
MQDFISFLPIVVVVGTIASAVHARYRLDHQREHLFHRQREFTRRSKILSSASHWLIGDARRRRVFSSRGSTRPGCSYPR